MVAQNGSSNDRGAHCSGVVGGMAQAERARPQTLPSTLARRMSEFLTIAELGRRTGVTTSALRYYDALGLVRPIRRVSGHRRYAVDAVAAVAAVKLFREVGFTLAETKRLMDSRKRAPVAWRALAVRKSEELRHRIEKDEAALHASAPEAEHIEQRSRRWGCSQTSLDPPDRLEDGTPAAGSA
jgi:DNA-binding transcriptional MerR regulator